MTREAFPHFVELEGGSRAIDPRFALLMALASVIAVSSSRNPLYPAAFFIISIAGLYRLKVPFRRIAAGFAAPVMMGAMAFLLQSFLTGSTPLWTVHAARFTISMKAEGIQLGLITVSRIIGAVSVFLLFAHSIPAHEVFPALRWMRLGRSWIELAQTIHRNVFTLGDSSRDMYSAMKTRLGFSGAMKSMTSAGTLAGAITMNAAERASRSHEAMIARGYNGVIPVAMMEAFGGRRWLNLAAGLSAVLVSYLLVGAA